MGGPTKKGARDHGTTEASGRSGVLRAFVAGARWPLLHFVIIGFALFWLTHIFGDTRDPASYRIVISRGQVNRLVASFARVWGRPPDPDELEGLVDDYVQEEILVREALALGLDRDDLVIHRRLREKLEVLTAEDVAGVEPTETELSAFLERHRQALGANAAAAPLEEIRERVRDEWFAAQRAAALEEQYRTLRAHYMITVESAAPGGQPTGPGAASSTRSTPYTALARLDRVRVSTAVR